MRRHCRIHQDRRVTSITLRRILWLAVHKRHVPVVLSTLSPLLSQSRYRPPCHFDVVKHGIIKSQVRRRPGQRNDPVGDAIVAFRIGLFVVDTE